MFLLKETNTLNYHITLNKKYLYINKKLFFQSSDTNVLKNSLISLYLYPQTFKISPNCFNCPTKFSFGSITFLFYSTNSLALS